MLTGGIQIQRQPQTLTRAKFHYMPIVDKVASDEAGCTKHKQVEFITFFKGPGNEFSRKVEDKDKIAYAVQYAQFKNSEEQIPEGILLSEWPLMTVAQVADLKVHNIYTVEQLASLNEESVKALGTGGRNLMVKAQAFLAAAKDTALVQKQAEKIDFLQAQITELKETIALQDSCIKDLEKENRGKRVK